MARRSEVGVDQETYRAYMVRLWRDSSEASWRASAQSPESGEVIRFGDLKALYAFLNSQTVDEVHGATTSGPKAEDEDRSPEAPSSASPSDGDSREAH